MSEEDKKEICARANSYLNQLGHQAELISIESSIQEHELCYSISWCEKAELYLKPENRKMYVGGGRVFVSKINEEVEMAGSAPFVDWIRQFELTIQGLEEYWCMEIDYQKDKISSLKTLLQVNTPQLLKMIDENSQIIIEGEKYELDNMKLGFNQANITAVIKLKERKKS